MKDHTDDHLHSLEKQSQAFVEGEIERMKIRNRTREAEADRRRGRQRDDDANAELEGQQMVPQFKASIIESRRHCNNAEDMIVDLMIQSIAWRDAIPFIAKSNQIELDREQAQVVVQETLLGIKKDDTLVSEVRAWVKQNYTAEQPRDVLLNRLGKGPGTSVERPNPDPERQMARDLRREEDMERTKSFAGPQLVAYFQGAMTESRRYVDNAEDMVVELMLQNLAWRNALPKIAEAWAVELNVPQVNAIANQSLLDKLNNSNRVSECRAWAHQNYNCWEPQAIQMPRMAKSNKALIP